MSVRSTPIVTAWGFAALQREVKRLWQQRAEVTQALAAAAAEGDRSENAEYIYRKKELRALDRRIRYLQRRMPHLQVVRERPVDEQRVRFAAWVLLEAPDGRQACHRLVGPDETDLHPGGISIDAPLARALLGRAEDDVVRLTAPGGRQQWHLVQVRYQPPEDEPRPPKWDAC